MNPQEQAGSLEETGADIMKTKAMNTLLKNDMLLWPLQMKQPTEWSFIRREMRRTNPCSFMWATMPRTHLCKRSQIGTQSVVIFPTYGEDNSVAWLWDWTRALVVWWKVPGQTEHGSKFKTIDWSVFLVKMPFSSHVSGQRWVTTQL